MISAASRRVAAALAGPAALSLILALAACAAAPDQSTDTGETDDSAEKEAVIAPRSLAARIARRDPDLLILDVRTPEEFQAGRIPGAVNIPYSHLPARLAELPPVDGKDIVLYCETGVRTARAIERLRENGYTRLRHLEGDMRGWRASGGSVEQ